MTVILYLCVNNDSPEGSGREFDRPGGFELLTGKVNFIKSEVL